MAPKNPAQNPAPLAASATPANAPAATPAQKPVSPAKKEAFKVIDQFLAGKEALDPKDWSKTKDGFLGSLNSWAADTASYSKEFRKQATDLRANLKDQYTKLSETKITPAKLKSFVKKLEDKQKQLEDSAEFDARQKSLESKKQKVQVIKVEIEEFFGEKNLESYGEDRLNGVKIPKPAKTQLITIISTAVLKAKTDAIGKITDLDQKIAKGKTLKTKDLGQLLSIETSVTEGMDNLPKNLKEAITQSTTTQLELKKIDEFMQTTVFIRTVPKDSVLCIAAFNKSIEDFKVNKLNPKEAVDAILWGRATDIVNVHLKEKLTTNEVHTSVKYYELGKYKNGKEKGKSQKIINALIASKDQLIKEGINFNFKGGTDATDHNVDLVNKQTLTWHQEKAEALKTLTTLIQINQVVPAIRLSGQQNTILDLYMTAVGTGDLGKIKLVVNSYKSELTNGKELFDLALCVQRAQDFKRHFTGNKDATINKDDTIYIEIGQTVQKDDERKSGLELSLTTAKKTPEKTSKKTPEKPVDDPIERAYQFAVDPKETVKLQKKLPPNLRGKGFFVDITGLIRRKDKGIDKKVYTLIGGPSLLSEEAGKPTLILLPGKDPDNDWQDYEKHKEQEVEKYLPKNLHGKGFYTDPTGLLRKKGKKGHYEVKTDGSVIGTTSTGKKYIMAPGADPDAKGVWKPYVAPVTNSTLSELPRDLSVGKKEVAKKAADNKLGQASKALDNAKKSLSNVSKKKSKIDEEINKLKANNAILAATKTKALKVLAKSSSNQQKKIETLRKTVSKRSAALAEAQKEAANASKQYDRAKKRADFLDTFTPRLKAVLHSMDDAQKELDEATAGKDEKKIITAAKKLTEAIKAWEGLIVEEAKHLAKEKDESNDDQEKKEINEDTKKVFQSQLRSLASAHGLNSQLFSQWNDEEYDYPEMLENLPNLIRTFNMLDQRGHLKSLDANSKIKLNPSSWNTINEGYNSETNEIVLDITEDPESIIADFLDGAAGLKKNKPAAPKAPDAPATKPVKPAAKAPVAPAAKPKPSAAPPTAPANQVDSAASENLKTKLLAGKQAISAEMQKVKDAINANESFITQGQALSKFKENKTKMNSVFSKVESILRQAEQQANSGNMAESVNSFNQAESILKTELNNAQSRDAKEGLLKGKTQKAISALRAEIAKQGQIVGSAFERKRKADAKPAPAAAASTAPAAKLKPTPAAPAEAAALHPEALHFGTEEEQPEAEINKSIDKLLVAINSPKNKDKYVVVEFSAKDCPPCQFMKPAFSKYASSPRESNIAVMGFNTQTLGNGELLNNKGINIQSWPTIFIYKNGKVLASAGGSNAMVVGGRLIAEDVGKRVSRMVKSLETANPTGMINEKYIMFSEEIKAGSVKKLSGTTFNKELKKHIRKYTKRVKNGWKKVEPLTYGLETNKITNFVDSSRHSEIVRQKVNGQYAYYFNDSGDLYQID